MASFDLILENISLLVFKEVIKNNELLPGRKMLQENIDEYFDILKVAGIENLQQLDLALKNKKKLESFSGKYEIPLEYLTILRRELGSYFPKPVNLSDFPNLPAEVISVLAGQGIQNSKIYFEKGFSPEQRQKLAEDTGLDEAVLLELAYLCDLSRVGGVGPVFARMLYDCGIQKIEELHNLAAEEIKQKFDELNAREGYTAVSLGLKDIRYCQDKARFLDEGVEI